VEVKKCEKTSDRTCMCVAGYMPDVRYTLGSGKLAVCQALQALASTSDEMLVISSVKAVVICLIGISTQVL